MRRSRPAARRQCRTASEVARGDGAAVRATIPRPSPARSRSPSLPLLARRAQIRISRRAGAAGQDRRSSIWRSSPGRARRSAIRRTDIPTAFRTKCKTALREELALIAKLDYAPYFLTVHDIVAFARGRQGHPLPGPRLGGQLAPSATASASPRSIPSEIDLLFERFISRRARRAARHRRRFRARAARGGDPVHLRALRPRPRRDLPRPSSATAPRSAIREVGKALGPRPRTSTAALAKHASGAMATARRRTSTSAEAGLDPADPRDPRRRSRSPTS